MENNIGNRLKQLRIEHNFTQKQVADYLNFNQGQIAKLEKNERKLKHNSLIKLCKLYNCSPEYILKGIGEYSKINLVFRSNNKNSELETFAEMSNIINNLEFLARINNK